jgi:hypothetical protein
VATCVNPARYILPVPEVGRCSDETMSSASMDRYRGAVIEVNGLALPNSITEFSNFLIQGYATTTGFRPSPARTNLTSYRTCVRTRLLAHTVSSLCSDRPAMTFNSGIQSSRSESKAPRLCGRCSIEEEVGGRRGSSGSQPRPCTTLVLLADVNNHSGRATRSCST